MANITGYAHAFLAPLHSFMMDTIGYDIAKAGWDHYDPTLYVVDTAFGLDSFYTGGGLRRIVAIPHITDTSDTPITRHSLNYIMSMDNSDDGSGGRVASGSFGKINDKETMRVFASYETSENNDPIIVFNITHKISNGANFESTGADIKVTGIDYYLVGFDNYDDYKTKVAINGHQNPVTSEYDFPDYWTGATPTNRQLLEYICDNVDTIPTGGSVTYNLHAKFYVSTM